MKGRIAIVALVLAVVAQASLWEDSAKPPIPNKPASGMLHGKPFAPRFVTLKKLGFNTAGQSGRVEDRAQAYILEFASDDDLFPSLELSVWFSTNPGENLVGKSMNMKPFAFGTPEYRKQLYGNRTGALVPRGVTAIFTSSAKPSVSEQYSDRFSLQLTFTKRTGRSIQGKVNLTLPDKAKSRLMGNFTAAIQ